MPHEDFGTRRPDGRKLYSGPPAGLFAGTVPRRWSEEDRGAYPMNTANDLMAGVTQAIFKAEQALDDAIAAYEALKAAEEAILRSTDPEITEQDKTISERGVENCQRILTILRDAPIPPQPLVSTQAVGSHQIET